jgi:hypothetical protein
MFSGRVGRSDSTCDTPRKTNFNLHWGYSDALRKGRQIPTLRKGRQTPHVTLLVLLLLQTHIMIKERTGLGLLQGNIYVVISDTDIP